MVGLVIKDCYTVFQKTKLFMVFALVMAAIPSDFMFGYSVFYAAMLPITALSFDEQAKWDRYADMLPYTTSAIIGSKYVIGYLSVGVIALFTLAVKSILALSGRGEVGAETFIAMGFVVCFAWIIQALNLMFIFWLGTEKGRLLFVATTVVSLMGIVSLLQDIEPLLSRIQISAFAAGLGLVGITAAVNLISFLASKALYQHKRK